VVAAPLVAVVVRTEATEARLPCAAATVALQATRPEEEVTAAATVAVVELLAAASTHTERQSTRTKTHTT
jgi:hypothetical protein